MQFELLSKKNTVEKNGETKHYTNFYLLLPSGKYVPIKPAFNNDYKSLVLLAKDVTEDTKKGEK